MSWILSRFETLQLVFVHAQALSMAVTHSLICIQQSVQLLLIIDTVRQTEVTDLCHLSQNSRLSLLHSHSLSLYGGRLGGRHPGHLHLPNYQVEQSRCPQVALRSPMRIVALHLINGTLFLNSCQFDSTAFAAQRLHLRFIYFFVLEWLLLNEQH